MPLLLTVNDLRCRARRRMPRAIFDFVEGGAGHELAMRRNESVFDDVRLLPRVLAPCAQRQLDTRLLGVDHNAPFGVSPMGLGNLAWPGTDEALMRACAAARIPYGLSMAGSSTVERIAGLGGGYAWFQIYMTADFGIVLRAMERAERAGVQTLVLTVDAAHPARRLRNARNGFGQSFITHPWLMADYALHPAWSLRTLAAGQPFMANLVSEAGHAAGGGGAAYVLMDAMTRARLDWDSLAQVRAQWRGKLLVKGVLDPRDAVRIQAAGADGIIVSNHGGRQLESVVTSLEVLPAVRAAVGPDYPLLLDSGVRSGEDIAKALVLGADFVLLGRPFLYASAALGPQAGAERIIAMLKAELSDTMAQLGCACIADLNTERLWKA